MSIFPNNAIIHPFNELLLKNQLNNTIRCVVFFTINIIKGITAVKVPEAISQCMANLDINTLGYQ